MQNKSNNILKKEDKNDTTSHKILSLLAVWVMVSIFGVLFAMLSIVIVFFIKDGSISNMLQDNMIGSDKNIALISMIIGGSIGLTLAIKTWAIIMKKTKFVSNEFVDKWLG